MLRSDEIERVTALLLEPPSPSAHARVHAALTPAVDRFRADLDEERQEGFRDALTRFVRTYAFLSVRFGDPMLERDYLFAKALSRLIRRAPGEGLDLGEQVELSHLRQELAHEGGIALPDADSEVHTIIDGAGRRRELDEEPLSRIVEQLNERFGMNMTEADRLHLDGVAADLVADPGLQRQAAANTRENFGVAFEKRYVEALIQRLSSNEDLTYRIVDSDALLSDIVERYLPLVYGRARVAHQEHQPIGELLGQREGAHLERKVTALGLVEIRAPR